VPASRNEYTLNLAKRAEYGIHKISAASWSSTYRPAVSHERFRQARHLWSDDSLYWQCGLAVGPLGWAIAVAFEIGGGLLLVLGFRAREVAIGLAVFTLAAAVFFHRNFADQNQMIHFSRTS